MTTDQRRVDADPRDPLATGDALARDGRLADAAAAYLHAADTGAGVLPALHRLMLTLARLQEWTRLETTIGRALDVDRDDAEAWYWRGVLAHQRRNDLAEAARCFRRTLAVRPNHRAATEGLRVVAAPQPPPGPGSAAPPPARPTPAPAPAPAPAPVAEPPTTLAEFLDRRQDLTAAPGPLLFPPCRPLIRSILVDSWPVLLLVGAYLLWPTRDGQQSADWVSGVVTTTWNTVRPLLPATAAGFLIYAVLRWWTTEYRIHERRIEVDSGVLYRRHQVLWLYEVPRPIVVTQNLPQILLDTGTIVIESGQLPRRQGFMVQLGLAGRSPTADPWGQLRLATIASTDRSCALADDLRRAVLRERRAMLDRFIANP